MIINTNYVKKGVNLVVGFSVGAIVKRIIQNNADPEGKLQEAETFVACIALGGMVAKAATDYTDDKIDHFFAKFEEIPETPEPETEE